MSVLPDVLEPGLAVVFCGTAASKRSAEIGAPYAGPGNKFWDILADTGLTPERLDPRDFKTVSQYGIGLTGMAPDAIGNDDVLGQDDFAPAQLRAKIERFQPRILAFVGKRAAQEFLDRKQVDYGPQPDRIGNTAIWVLPSTSGAARRYWDEAPWHALAKVVRGD